MSRAVALALTLATAASSSGCATYEGSRNTAALGAGTFALTTAMFITSSQMGEAEDTAIAYSSAALATMSMMIVITSAVGMVVLPKEVEVALQIAHGLVVRAEAGDCDTVARRRGEVEALDGLVYEVVLMQDPAVARCFEPSSSASSSSSSSPADREHPDPASTSIAR